MSNNPKISIIIPIYNVDKYLNQALESVRNQTYKNYEVIMVNDASTDSSLKIAQGFLKDLRFSLIDCKTNGGLSKARNIGTLKAKGEWVYYFDSDDVLPLNLLRNLVDLMVEDIDLISFNYSILSEKEKKIIRNINDVKVFSQQECLEQLLNSKMVFAPWSYIFRKKILTLDIKFPEGRNFEDISFNVQLISRVRKMKLVRFEPSGYFYRKGRKGSITNSLTGDKFIKQIQDKLYLNNYKYNYLRSINFESNKLIVWYINELINIYFQYRRISEIKGVHKYFKRNKRIFIRIRHELISLKFGFKLLNFKDKIKVQIILNDLVERIYFGAGKFKYKDIDDLL